MNTESYTARCLRQYKAHTITTPEAHLIYIGKDQVDIFTDSGWTNRSRYRRIKGRWCHVCGPQVTAAMVDALV